MVITIQYWHLGHVEPPGLLLSILCRVVTLHSGVPHPEMSGMNMEDLFSQGKCLPTKAFCAAGNLESSYSWDVQPL